MIRLQRLLPAALCAVLFSAGADEKPPPSPTYRIVGPDGQVTFSDRRPTDPQVRTRELGKTVVAPLLVPSTGLFDLHPATTPPPVQRLSAADGLTPPLDIAGKPLPTGLPEAVLDVLIHQLFVQSLVETCVRQRPALAERYQAGVRNWRDRNADILGKSNHITFTRFTGEQRDTLRNTARARLMQLMPPPGAADAEKFEWCDRMSSDLVRRQFELVGDMRVAPVLYYEAP